MVTGAEPLRRDIVRGSEGTEFIEGPFGEEDCHSQLVVLRLAESDLLAGCIWCLVNRR